MISLIIGGTGFIGKYLIEELLASGRKVITVSRHYFQHDNVEHHEVETLFDEKIEKILNSGIDEVVYLAYATKPKTSFDNPVRDIEENLAQAVHLFESVYKIKTIRRIVYVSSGGTVYGNSISGAISEDHPKNPISPYGITKLTIEHFANMFFKIYGLPVIIVRPSNAYGIGQEAKEGQGFIAYAMQSILYNKPINIYGKEGTIRDYIYVSDVARAIRFCLDKGHCGNTYNIGTETGYTNSEIIRLIEKVIGNDYNVKLEYSESRPFDVNKNILDTSAIKKDTGWTPLISIEEGLSLTWQALIHTNRLTKQHSIK
jgi:UDP-glucose 4-epimerase